MQFLSFLTLAGVVALAVPLVSAEPIVPQYRGMTLGDPIEAVIARLQIPIADVKTLHDAPSLTQRATWRPQAYLSGASGELESVAEIVVTFYAGRLAEIAIAYDRARTQGLTDADVRDVMGGVYGPSLLLPTPAKPAPQVTIGRWQDMETVVILWREQFPNRIGLTITSIASDAALQAAIADGVRLETAGAPARDLAKRAADAEAIRERDEKIRLENKAKFKP